MMRSRVDLPPPLGPSSAVSWPVGMLTVTSSRATKSPKRLPTPETSMLMTFWSSGADRSPSWADDGHDDDAGHRDERQQEGGGVGAALVEVEVLLLDDEGGGAGLAEHVARHDLDRAELAERAGQAQHDAVDDAPLDGRQRDAPEGLPRVGAEAAGRLLLLDADLLEHRHDLADDQRQGHEDGGHDDAGRGEDDLEPRLQGGAEPAVAPAVDQDERQAHHDRRHRQRQVEQGVEQPLAGEPVAHEQDRDADAEHRVDDDGDHGDDHVGSCRACTTSGSSRMPRRSSSPSSKVFFATSDTGQATRRNR